MGNKKRATPWKAGKVISIGLRNGVYVLAQMVREPYLVFFNCFNLDKDWPGLDLNQEQILFCHAVTRQFLRFSSVTVQKNILPLEDYQLPGEWIYSHLGGSPVSLSLNGKTWDLKGFGGQYSLVKADKTAAYRKTILSWDSFSLISFLKFRRRTGLG